MSVTKIQEKSTCRVPHEFRNSSAMLFVPGFGIVMVEIRDNGSGKNAGIIGVMSSTEQMRFELSVALSREETTLSDLGRLC
jgi:hypothetical protein